MKRGTADHPKAHWLAEQLGIPPAHAVGLLFRLFEWCPTYALSGYFGRWTPADIARGAGWLGDPEVFVQGLITSRWVDVVPASAIADTARYGPADDPMGFLETPPETRHAPAENAPETHHQFATGNAPETRQRRHLVLHDVATHAEHWWRRRVRRAGYTWWDGSPSLGTPGRPSKKASRDAEIKTRQKTLKPVACSPEPVAGSGKLVSEKKGKGSARAARAPSAPFSGAGSSNGPEPPEAAAALVAVADPQQLMFAWNSCAPNLLPAHAMTATRVKLAHERLRERPGLDVWQDIFRRMNASPFLRGANDRRWRADLDFALKPETAIHVLEGRYDVPLGPPNDPLVDEARRRIAARMASR